MIFRRSIITITIIYLGDLMIVLRDYQQESIDDLRKTYKAGFNAPLLVARTGSGKTVMFSYIAQNAKGNVLILVHREQLLKQASRTLFNLGVDHGLISPAHNRTRHSVQIASVQTVINRLNEIPVPDLIIIDEAHHCVKNSSWRNVIDAFPSAKVLGVTASPTRTDGRALGDLFDTIILGAGFSRLVSEGHLVAPKIFSIEGDLDSGSIVGDCINHYRKYAHKKPAIVFCLSIQHAEDVAASFNDAGYQAKCIHGGMSREDQQRCIDQLNEGSMDLLTSCDLISEGTDIPRIECIIMLRKIRSLSLYIQQAGRLFRPSPGKIEGIIIDPVGNTKYMWDSYEYYIEDEYEWSLTQDIKKVKKSPPSLRQCEKCYKTFKPAPVCPGCGHAFESKVKEIEQVEGELIEVDREKIKLQVRQERAALKTLEDLQAYGRSKGYKDNWANHVWAARSKRSA